MNLQLLELIRQQNPWLMAQKEPILTLTNYRHRIQLETLKLKEWDSLCTLLIGPRRAGKTTLGKILCQTLIDEGRYKELIYLNCDLFEVRNWLKNPLFINDLKAYFPFTSPIVFIDEVQRLSSPGLFLKALIDLQKPIKWMASGSSQLEIKSQVTEHLTGRNFTSLVLPLSAAEWAYEDSLDELLLYGSYPQVIDTPKKELLLSFLYQDYINKDIVETLKLSQSDTFLKLLTLLAHSSGQLVNYQQLATDCQVSTTLIKHYLSIAEMTYIIASIKPFVGNKRVELTSNPIFYFIDNGIRNYALRNFTALDQRTDAGLLVQGLVFQECYKWITQHFLDFTIHYWRTKSGAEVDFVIRKNDQSFLPIEVKYQNLKKPSLSRGFRSFLEAYQPKHAIVITKDLLEIVQVYGSEVHFIPIKMLKHALSFIHQLN